MFLRLFFLNFFCLVVPIYICGQDNVADVENDMVKKFLDEVTYTRYSQSRISEFTDSTMRLDIPKPVLLTLPDTDEDSLMICYFDSLNMERADTLKVAASEREVSIYNLIPQHTYYYRVISDSLAVDSGSINVRGRVRMIYAPSVSNIRDLGGWETTDGRRVNYGKLYRGGELNGKHLATAEDIAELKRIGIGAELDLRYRTESGSNYSAFDFLKSSQIQDGDTPSYLFLNNTCSASNELANITWLNRYKSAFTFINNNFKHKRPVYFHCVWGADRTGYLAVLLEGLLGVTYDGIAKDYELTSFTGNQRGKISADNIISFMETLSGTSIQDQFRTYFTDYVGVNDEDIDYFISEMLEEKKGTTTDLNTIEINNNYISTKVIRNFDVVGRQLSSKGKGIVIQQMTDGSVRKMVR